MHVVSEAHAAAENRPAAETSGLAPAPWTDPTLPAPNAFILWRNTTGFTCHTFRTAQKYCEAHGAAESRPAAKTSGLQPAPQTDPKHPVPIFKLHGGFESPFKHNEIVVIRIL